METKLVTISRLRELLQEIERSSGDIPVAAVDYHSDYKDKFLREEIIEDQLKIYKNKDCTYLLICGGSY